MLPAAAAVLVAGTAATKRSDWNAKAAAAYLDARATWWTTWSGAKRDRGTYCMSCHTTLPYALARPELRKLVGETEPSTTENLILGNLLTRARSWRDVEPWYPDQTRGIPKTSESRAIEAVMNALVLSRRDAAVGKLSEDTRIALDVMWALQMKTGPESGAWTWLNFKLEPWESPNSPYFGASLAALAAGSAPEGYLGAADVVPRVKALREYFQRQHAKVSLLNQAYGLWASSGIPDLLTGEQRQATIDSVFAHQASDGGWSTASLGAYKRVDQTAADTSSDGYATALVTLALQAAGLHASDVRVNKGLDWLRRNQDPATGRWIAVSPNKQRDPASDTGKFMSDAATAYAVLSLTYRK
jgi:squalene-hopene/tetraprenyl-beta-curcumene cyclase